MKMRVYSYYPRALSQHNSSLAVSACGISVCVSVCIIKPNLTEIARKVRLQAKHIRFCTQHSCEKDHVCPTAPGQDETWDESMRACGFPSSSLIFPHLGHNYISKSKRDM